MLSRPLQSSFQVDMVLACYTYLYSQRYIVGNVDLVDFLSQSMALVYNIQQIITSANLVSKSLILGMG